MSTAANGGDLLASAATAVLRATHHLSSHEVHDAIDESLEYGLDTRETHAIWLANDLSAPMYVTDEFNSTNYLLISLALDDRNILYTTPHLLCVLADHRAIPHEYVDHALSYYVAVKDWDQAYIEQLRAQYLTTDES